MTAKVRVCSSPSLRAVKAADCGEDCQPAGRSRCTSAGADAFTLLRTRTFTTAGFRSPRGNDARSGGGGHGDRRRYEQRLVDTAATDHMLDRLHRLAGTDVTPSTVNSSHASKG